MSTMIDTHGSWYRDLWAAHLRGPVMRKRRPKQELAEYRHLLALQVIAPRETLAQRIAFDRRQARINFLYKRLY
jgi:hypothetical protein